MARVLSRVQSARGRERWAGIVEDLSRTGLSVASYAQTHGLSARSLFWWRWKLRSEVRGGGSAARLDLPRVTKASPPQTFVPVRVLAGSAPAPTDGALYVLLSGGRRIEIGAGFDSDTLERLIRTLEAIPC